MAGLRVGTESMSEIGGRLGVAAWTCAKERCGRARS